MGESFKLSEHFPSDTFPLSRSPLPNLLNSHQQGTEYSNAGACWGHLFIYFKLQQQLMCDALEVGNSDKEKIHDLIKGIIILSISVAWINPIEQIKYLAKGPPLRKAGQPLGRWIYYKLAFNIWIWAHREAMKAKSCHCLRRGCGCTNTWAHRADVIAQYRAGMCTLVLSLGLQIRVKELL